MSSTSLLSQYTNTSSSSELLSATQGNRPTRTLVFSSQKGGSGKTTLCGQLAVQAELAGMGPVALIDTDPQGSLSDWWNARGEQTPMFVQTTVERLYDTLEDLRQIGVKMVFIDTQPTVTDTIRDIIQFADMVVIPTRPSPHDLRAIGPTVDLVENCNKPMVFAINCATRRAKLTGDVAMALSQHGTVAPTVVHNRIDFASSMIDGRSVMESNPDGKSAMEIRMLFDYLSERLNRLERDEGYQTYETVIAPNAPLGASSTASTEPQQSPFKMRNAREAEQQPTGFGRRMETTFGRRKSDGFGNAPTEAEMG